MSKNTDKKESKESIMVPLKVPVQMDRALAEVAKKSGLSKADIMRLSIERGIAVVEKMFEPQKQAA